MDSPRTRYRPLQAIKSMRWYEWVLAAIVILLPLLGGFLGARLFNTGAYKKGGISKPPWAPPPWLFSPVWSIIYLSMGFASYLIYRVGGGLNVTTVPPLILYTVQLIINWAWTPTFFGFGYFAVALAELWAMWGLVFACTITFYPVSKIASLLFVPYFVWLSFAGVLNLSMLCLNSCVVDMNLNNTGL